MFDDARSRKIVLLAHCLVNQNSISDGTADFPSQFREIIDLIMDNRVGIIQLPCPELLCLGLDRGDPGGGARKLLKENSRIRSLMESGRPAEKMREQARLIAGQVEEYRKHGFEVIGIIGINRSPSCGLETTTRGNAEAPGWGVFMDILIGELEAKGISLPAVGVKTSEPDESLLKVKRILFPG